MTLHSSCLRLPCFFALCTWLFLQSASSQIGKSGKPENANTKPVVHFSDVAQKAGLTLIGRAKGKRFIALAGSERIVFDDDPGKIEEEAPRLKRKASVDLD